MSALALRSAESCRWDCVSLGEVMLRLDPGDGRIHTTRTFQAWEGGGEYNVARGLKRCFGLDTAVVTALADNPVGRLVRGPDVPGRRRSARTYAGCSTTASAAPCATASTSPSAASACARAVGCSDRGHTAIVAADRRRHRLGRGSSARGGSRWFHTGGIFCALSETTPLVAEEAMAAAHAARHARLVRPQLPRLAVEVASAARRKAREVNRRLAPYVDVHARQRRGLLGGAGLRGRGRRRALQRAATRPSSRR